MLTVTYEGTYDSAIRTLQELPEWARASGRLCITLKAHRPANEAARDAAVQHVGRKIDAIKAVRGVTGWGLAEAKDFVDTLPEFAEMKCR